MKKLINENQASMEDIIGEQVTIFCCNYIYTGKLVGVNTSFVELVEAKIVYETGSLTSNLWKDAQELPHRWSIMKGAIESWGILDKEN